MNPTQIPYLDYTWNPTHGCSADFDCYDRCWARTMAKRLAGMGAYRYDRDDPFKVTLHPERLREPTLIKKPARIGVSFMGDLFHDEVPFTYIKGVWDTIYHHSFPADPRGMIFPTRHEFLILTKRISRVWEFYKWMSLEFTRNSGYDNIWLGTSISTQQDADERIPILLSIPAAVHFISAEPLLENINIAPYMPLIGTRCFDGGVCHHKCIDVCFRKGFAGLSEPDTFISLIIVGCESGPGRRHTPTDAFRSLRDQCAAAGIPYFLKQMEIDGRVVAMPELDGVVHDALPKTGRES